MYQLSKSVLMTICMALLVALGASVPLNSAQAAGPAFPSKEIHMIVPWSPGGSVDMTARMMQKLAAEDNIRITVDNVPGAGSIIGLTKVASAPADGYTVGIATTSLLTLIAQDMTKIRNEQFTFLNQVSLEQLVLLVPKGGPAQTLEEFIALMKKNPGKISIGTPGNNNLNHIFAAMTAKVAGVDFVNVPYPGGSKVLSDLSGKQIDGAVLKPSESRALIEAGMVLPIGVFSKTRNPMLPSVPTLQEKGHDVFPYGPLEMFSYLVAPANLPADISTRLASIFHKALQHAEYAKFAKENGFTNPDVSGDQLRQKVYGMQKTLNEVAPKFFKKQ
jgi:tripartite-type tricarboxylate transporter receptor subunit TctC